jgi:hypothetical protein
VTKFSVLAVGPTKAGTDEQLLCDLRARTNRIEAQLAAPKIAPAWNTVAVTAMASQRESAAGRRRQLLYDMSRALTHIEALVVPFKAALTAAERAARPSKSELAAKLSSRREEKEWRKVAREHFAERIANLAPRQGAGVASEIVDYLDAHGIWHPKQHEVEVFIREEKKTQDQRRSPK